MQTPGQAMRAAIVDEIIRRLEEHVAQGCPHEPECADVIQQHRQEGPSDQIADALAALAELVFAAHDAAYGLIHGEEISAPNRKRAAGERLAVAADKAEMIRQALEGAAARLARVEGALGECVVVLEALRATECNRAEAYLCREVQDQIVRATDEARAALAGGGGDETAKG